MSGSRGDCGGPGTPPPAMEFELSRALATQISQKKVVSLHLSPLWQQSWETGSNVGPRLPKTKRSNHVCSLLQWGSGEVFKEQISHWSRTDMVLRTEKYLLTVSNLSVTCMKGPVCLGKSKRGLKPGHASDKPRSSGSPTLLPNENLREMA